MSASGDRITAETLQSDVGPHPRYSGPDGGGEKKYKDRHGQHLDRYYDEVISRLGQPEASASNATLCLAFTIRGSAPMSPSPHVHC